MSMSKIDRWRWKLLALALTVLASVPTMERTAGAKGHRPHATSPAQRCAAAKLKAVGRGIAGEMGCYATAQAHGLGVDAGCLSAKQAKADALINRAGDACPGSQSDLDSVITSCVKQLHVDTQGSTKCSSA